MEEFVKAAVITIGIIFCIFLILIPIAQEHNKGICKEKGGFYASPHCFKKESLME